MLSTIVCLLAVLQWPASCQSAENETKIVYPDPPKGTPYKTEIHHESNVAMNGWYNAMKLFVRTVQPNKPPVETFYGYVTGKKEFEMPDSLVQILDLEKGFVVCIIFGLLFAIIMPIVGLIFCLCRMCGNCGGKMVQAQKDDLDCRRRTYFFSLFGTFFFMIIAVITLYACNENMGQAIPITHKTVLDNIDDSQSFMNNTYTELMFIVEDSLDVAVDGLFSTLDNIDKTLGVGVRSALSSAYDVEEVFDKAYLVANDAQKVLKDVITIIVNSNLIKDGSVKELKPLVSKISDELKGFKNSQCQGQSNPLIKDICTYPDIVFDYADAFTKFDVDINKHMAEIKKVVNDDLTKYVKMAEDQFNKIPSHVKDNTVALRNDIKATISTIRSNIRNSPQLEQLKEVKTTVITSTDEAKVKIDETIGTIEEYSNMRWYVGLFVCIMVSICVGLIFAGICMGLLGHKSDALPTQRSVVSNLGGVSLMGSVGFMFLFASPLMLATTAFFLVGAHGEAFVCDIMYNDIPLLDKIKDMATEDFTQEPFIQNIQLSKVLRDCKDNEPAYVALGLQKHFNISAIKGLVDRDKINHEIDTLKVNLDVIQVLPPKLNELLETYINGVNINFTKYIEILEDTVLKVDISTYVDKLEEYVDLIMAPKGTPPTIQKGLDVGLKALKNNIEDVKDKLKGLLPKVKTLQNKLLKFISENKGTLGDFHISLQNILKQLMALKKKVLAGVMDVVRKPIHGYKDLLLGEVDNYIDYLQKQATENLAKCRPLWNVYDSTRFVICKLLLDPFNGFWFGLGWCLAFFIPAILFSIKLSRHYRKMQYTEFEGNEVDCDRKGTKLDKNWKYGRSNDEDKHWTRQEMQPIHAYDNQNFHPDNQAWSGYNVKAQHGRPEDHTMGPSPPYCQHPSAPRYE